MPSTLSSPRQTDIAHERSFGDSFASVQLPLDSPPSDLEEAVHALRKRPTEELQRARKHHCRALKSLRDGGYDALPEETREQLVQRLQSSLTALNKALEPESSEANTSSGEPASSLFQKALTWLW